MYKVVQKAVVVISGVAPFPGATTGTGGRIRDVQSTGKGAHVVAGTAGYSFGNLNIPGTILIKQMENFVNWILHGANFK